MTAASLSDHKECIFETTYLILKLSCSPSIVDTLRVQRMVRKVIKQLF